MGLALALVAGAAGSAAGDRREASVHAHVIGGAFAVRDEAAADTALGPAFGAAVRASRATHNIFQYDASFAVIAGRVHFGAGRFAVSGQPPRTGPFTIAQVIARVDGGATLRLGVAWIPTVRVAVGLQARRRGSPVAILGGVEVGGAALGRRADYHVDAVASIAAGLDHRLNRRLVVGASAGASHAVPLGGPAFDSLELTVHAAYYWYPR